MWRRKIGDTAETAVAEADTVEWSDVKFAKRTWLCKERVADFRISQNLTLFLHSSVTELIVNSEGTRVTSAQIECIGGNRYRVKARRYVLATGGIENPRILLASNSVIESGIANQNDVVGRYFMEHPRIAERFGLPGDSIALASRVSGTLKFSRLQLTEKVQEQEELLNYQASLSFGYLGQKSDQWEAIRRIGYRSLKHWRDFPYYIDMEGGRNHYRWQDFMTILKRPDRSISGILGFVFRFGILRRWLQIESSIEQSPLAHNRVMLSSRKDRFGTPLSKLEWTISEEEKQTYKRRLQLVLQELDQLEPGISSMRMDDPPSWPDEVLGTWHHMGATRMHESPAQGVVDADCKVHDVANLYIAGSSVFPSSGVHSPTLTIVSLVLRLAKHLGRKI